MSEGVARPVVLDATVLSNFASSGAVDQLGTLLDCPSTVRTVQAELEQGSRTYGFLDDALSHIGDTIAVTDIDGLDGSQTDRIRARLDEGEAAALCKALDEGGTLATDDLAARRTASDHGVPVTGSVGLLALGVRRGVFSVQTANQWLGTWREKRGYYAPVDSIEDVLD